MAKPKSFFPFLFFKPFIVLLQYPNVLQLEDMTILFHGSISQSTSNLVQVLKSNAAQNHHTTTTTVVDCLFLKCHVTLMPDERGHTLETEGSSHDGSWFSFFSSKNVLFSPRSNRIHSCQLDYGVDESSYVTDGQVYNWEATDMPQWQQKCRSDTGKYMLAWRTKCHPVALRSKRWVNLVA